jgi:hypothetical protein
MGRFLGHRDLSLSTRLQIALEMFYAADDLAPIQRRIDLVRKSSVSGYRGAVAIDEIICQRFPRPEMPPSGTLVAVDGSQIYPDQHAPTLYYLINLSAFTCYYGESRIPDQATDPQLFYKDTEVQDADGRLISNLTVNARRSVAEMQTLAKQAWTLRGEARPLVTLYDGGLLKFFGANEVADAAKIEQDYMEALQRLQDARATLSGYVDKPRSTYIISLLHLLDLEPEDVNDYNLKTNGEIEGLSDVYLLNHVLQPGERSAIMAQNSPQNREYKDRDPSYEIAFFYVNVSDNPAPTIARIDVPMWVAQDKRAIDDLHALILAQCAIQGRRHYPYALTRADELAYVSSVDKQQLNELINVELLKNRVEREASNKLQTKGLARGSKRQHKIGSR